jgi:predicted dehydrogenase
MIRLGVVGLGFGRYGLIPAFRRDSRCVIEAVCGRNAETTSRWADELGVKRRFLDFRELVECADVDAVVIATPPVEQASIARLALSRGKAVFAEKPLARDASEARDLAYAAAAAGIPNVVDFLFQEIAAWRRAHELLTAGAIGPLRHVLVEWTMESFDYRRQMSTWKTRAEEGGGALSHFGSHLLFYLENFLGPIQRMTASLSRAPTLEQPGDTLATLALEFPGGVTASVALSSVAPFGGTHRLVFHGDEGTLRLENATADPVRGFRLFLATRASPIVSDLNVAEDEEKRDGEDSRVAVVSRLASRFLTWIETGAPTRPTFADGLRVQQLLELAASSSASGAAVHCGLDTLER